MGAGCGVNEQHGDAGIQRKVFHQNYAWSESGSRHLAHLTYGLHRERGRKNGGHPVALIAALVDQRKHGADLTLEVGHGDRGQPLPQLARNT